MTQAIPPTFQGYPVVTHEVWVGRRTYRLLAPKGAEKLLERPAVAKRFERDEYMPYWAELWPASLLLAEEVLRWGPAAGHPQPPGVLELGCGLGLVGIVAASLGYPVILSDYDDDALAFAAENARRNGLPGLPTRRVDWRESHSDLRAERILAADVLYETRHHRPVAEFIRAHLAGTGFAWVCDPDRVTADGFETVARHCALSVETRTARRPKDGSQGAVSGRVFHIRHKPALGVPSRAAV